MSVAINTILGFIWFTIFFGRQYAMALGKNYTPEEKPDALYIIGPIVCGFMNVLAMDFLIHALALDTLAEALLFGAVVGIGLIASTNVNSGINPNIPRPMLYGLVSGSYFVVSSLIISIILVITN